MLQVARLSPRLLGDSADLVRKFLESRLNPDGGFQDRAGRSDIYYTVFGIEALVALRADIPAVRIAAYLREFGDGSHLDFVHLSCLIRCWASIPPSHHIELPTEAWLQRVERYRSADGGYAAEIAAADGTAYGCFVALGAYQDLGRDIPNPAGILHCLDRLKADDGGYANQRDVPMGLTPTTAAVVAIHKQLGEPLGPQVADWLLARCRPEGGFFATPFAPLPDLLSTATALHALSCLHAALDPIRDPCLDFLDTLWTNQGAFHGNWSDDDLDCEYTYYGLLALGHLAV